MILILLTFMLFVMIDLVLINKAKAKGDLTKREKKLVEAWAEHRNELLNNWDLMMRENRVNDIEPLK